MTQDDVDATILDAAGAVFDDPALQMQRFKEAQSRGLFPADSGLAQSGDFGIGIMFEIRDIATAAWKYAEAWWTQNGGNVEARLLVEAILVALRNLRFGGKSGGGPESVSQMGSDERVAVTNRVANFVAAKGGQPSA